MTGMRDKEKTKYEAEAKIGSGDSMLWIVKVQGKKD